MRVRTFLLATMIVLAPFGARADDLVVWWERGRYPEEDAAVREIVAAFERKTGRHVDLTFHSEDDLSGGTAAAVEAGHPPDFVYGTLIAYIHFPHWAHDGRLADLTDTLGPLAVQFDRDALAQATLLDVTTGRRGLYILPMGRVTNHVHVWKSLLERAGFKLADVPKEWEPFWSFWCDKVQPAVRKATGRDDIFGIGVTMAEGASESFDVLAQFADGLTRDWP